MPARVFVGNLSYDTTERQLADLLSEAGQVLGVYFPADRQSQGTARVEFSRPDEAARCVERFNGREVAGRRLEVRIAAD